MSEEKRSTDDDGLMKLKNPNIDELHEDVLYHFGLSTVSHNLQQMFGDVKFVCTGGKPSSMERFAKYILKELNINIPTGTTLYDMTLPGGRYAMYKVGPVLVISHGMGIPSISIMLHETLKLTHHARCKNVTYIRVGTCGGIGLTPGSVIISETAVDALLQPYLELHILGKVVKRPAKLDLHLAQELLACSKPEDGYVTIIGKTMCTYDFYEGQGRLDGAFCDYTKEEKLAFLHKIYEAGVRNIEMESLCFAATVHHAGIPGAVVCVSLIDRLHGDQILAPKDSLDKFQERPDVLVARFIKKRLNMA